MADWKRAIAIDFDGTLCKNEYPDIGDPNWNVIYAALQEQKHGAGLILWTCREGKLLQDALEACAEWGLYFDAINDSLPEWKEHFGTTPRKIGADEYWDDKARAVKNGCFIDGEVDVQDVIYILDKFRDQHPEYNITIDAPESKPTAQFKNVHNIYDGMFGKEIVIDAE